MFNQKTIANENSNFISIILSWSKSAIVFDK